MPTLKDVAALAGVSAASVSLYLNGKADGRVSPLKQKAIDDAIAQLSYQPNAVSRQLRALSPQNSVHTVAVYWAADARSALLGKVMSGIQASILNNQNSQEFNIVICSFKSNELYHVKSLLEPEKYGHDAAIIANTSSIDMQYLNSITPTIPIVLLNRHLPQYHSVKINNHAMGAAIADLIAERGYKSVAVFRTLSPFPALNSRVNGFIDRCRQLKIELPNRSLFFTSDSTEGGIQAARDLIRVPQKPDVLFCDSDSIALGALYAFHEAGIRIPEDLSVVCISMNNSSIISCSIPALTASEVPLKKISQVCMDQIGEILRTGNKEPVHIELETEIVLRESFL